MFGYSSSEAIGKCVHKLVVSNSMCKEARERIDSSVKIFSETGTGYFTVGNVELVGCRKDGSEFPVELSISPMKIGNKWNAVGLVKDITDRKKTEQKLKEAEQRFHALFNQAPLGVLVIDPTTAAFVEFNDHAHLQLAYSREEFRELTLHDIEAKESNDETRWHLDEIVRNGNVEFETLHSTKYGEIRNVLVTARTIEIANKTLLHCIFHDITEIRKIQNNLMKSEAQYRQLVELAQAGIWAINRDFVTTFVNPRMSEMLGYTENEMTGKKIAEFIEPSMVEKIGSIMKKHNDNVSKGEYEYAFSRKDGTCINTSLEVSALTDDQGSPNGALVLVTDVTERKRLEDEFRASEERFRAISTSAMDAIILVNEETEVIYWNPAAEKTFGFKETEITGKKLFELVIPSNGPKAQSLLLDELKHISFSKRYYEITALKKNHSELPIDLSVTSIKLHDKNCLLLIARDISEQKQMEASIKQERDMLEGHNRKHWRWLRNSR